MKKKNILSSAILIACLFQPALCNKVYAAPNNIQIGTSHQDQLKILDEEIANNLQIINSLNKKHKELIKNIKDNTGKLTKLEKEYSQAEEKFNYMCQLSYMHNYDVSLLSVLISSKTLSEFYNRYMFINTIFKEQQNIFSTYKQTKEKLELTKSTLEKEKSQLNSTYKEQIQKSKELELKKKELETALAHNTVINSTIKQESSAMLNKLVFSRGTINTRTNILNFASSFLGMPYKWGGSNPNESFDCSGLTQYTYSKFGISLPRTAAMQQQVGIEVPSLANSQPGDLVFFGSPAHHVGMYVGNGYMLHAPHTGDNIKISPISNPTNIKRIIPD